MFPFGFVLVLDLAMVMVLDFTTIEIIVRERNFVVKVV